MTETHEYVGTETLRDSADQVVRSLVEQQRTGDDLVRVGPCSVCGQPHEHPLHATGWTPTW